LIAVIIKQLPQGIKQSPAANVSIPSQQQLSTQQSAQQIIITDQEKQAQIAAGKMKEEQERLSAQKTTLDQEAKIAESIRQKEEEDKWEIRNLVLSANSLVKVTLLEELDGSQDRKGRLFRAKLAYPIQAGFDSVGETGNEIDGIIVDSHVEFPQQYIGVGVLCLQLSSLHTKAGSIEIPTRNVCGRADEPMKHTFQIGDSINYPLFKAGTLLAFQLSQDIPVTIRVKR
jgi:hypothetical protein